MTSSSYRNDDRFMLVAMCATVATVTAAVAHILTKQNEDRKHKAHVWKQYQREKMLKEKTAAARLAKKEPPSGKLIEDVYVDKVYLWECEDLRKNFDSANLENVMKSDMTIVSSVIPFHHYAKAASSESLGQSYNKLITDHECILAKVVRKPNMETHTVAYMRAGPRRYLHFDPRTVNAAVVTCGGLCPGLNNVIREITLALHQLYGIGGEVYGIQGVSVVFTIPTPLSSRSSSHPISSPIFIIRAVPYWAVHGAALIWTRFWTSSMPRTSSSCT